MTPEQIIKEELSRLGTSTSPTESANILFNVIKITQKINDKVDTYKNIKKFMDFYIESMKSADYGYDNFNYNKIDELLKILTSEKQISVLQHIISVTARELPEHDRNWFIIRKHNAEIDHIFDSKKYREYPKAFLLYFGQSLLRLLTILITLFLLTFIVLLPAPIQTLAVLHVQLEIYSYSEFMNRILNVFALFADLDNNLKITPINWIGLCLIVLGKVTFITLIINFVYLKISDKIAQK